MINLIEILLLGSISGNTGKTAQAASMPEFAKEAHYYAQTFYREIRRKSRPPRFAFNMGMTFMSFIMWGQQFYGTVFLMALAWILISGFFKSHAWNRACDKGWAIINTRRAKEELIREAMFAAANKRLAIGG